MVPFIKSSTPQELGKQGEAYARKYLLSKGYKILHQNWRYKHLEVDLIAKKENRIIFIEVKTRLSDISNVEELISANKERSLLQALNVYMAHNKEDVFCQIDLLLLRKNVTSFEVRHLQNAIGMH